MLCGRWWKVGSVALEIERVEGRLASLSSAHLRCSPLSRVSTHSPLHTTSHSTPSPAPRHTPPLHSRLPKPLAGHPSWPPLSGGAGFLTTAPPCSLRDSRLIHLTPSTRMSIAASGGQLVSLRPSKSTQSLSTPPSSSTSPVASTVASSPPLPVSAFHIAASPAQLSQHRQSTAALLITLQPRPPCSSFTDLEELTVNLVSSRCALLLPPVRSCSLPPRLTSSLVRGASQDGCARRRPPVVPAYCPKRVHLEAGRTYRWCACGRSDDQPWSATGDPHSAAGGLSVAARQPSCRVE